MLHWGLPSVLLTAQLFSPSEAQQRPPSHPPPQNTLNHGLNVQERRIKPITLHPISQENFFIRRQLTRVQVWSPSTTPTASPGTFHSPNQCTTFLRKSLVNGPSLPPPAVESVSSCSSSYERGLCCALPAPSSRVAAATTPSRRAAVSRRILVFSSLQPVGCLL